jgi:hypothetical protein
MNNPLWGTRREVVLSVTLVAFASAAIAAAQWRTYGAAPAADPLVIEEKRVTFGRGGDVHLGPAAAPLFTLEVGSSSDPVGTGGEVALPEAIFAGVGNGNGYGSASYAGGTAGFTFGADVGHAARPRRSSSGGGGGGVGGGGGGFGFGGGAWGGVSGAAARPTSTGAGAAVAARPFGSGAPKLARETFGSAGGAASAGSPGVSGSPGASAGFSSSAPGIEAASLGIKVSELQGDPAPRGPGSAPTPEPVTLLLVGLGAAALYGARRHFV